MRWALGLEYDGSGFCGWQSQPAGCGVQDALERALGEIAGGPVRVTAAGRTDAGVHALAQVVHFDTIATRPANAWVRGANALLPRCASVLWARGVDDSFHARFSAVARTYRYLLLARAQRPALAAGRAGWFHQPLDLQAMREASALVVGEHDFSAFRSAECQARNPVRTLHEVRIESRGAWVLMSFTANAFLHHMVRNLVGCLVYVGAGRRAPEWLAEVLAARERRLAAPTFSADGLYLAGVRYPAHLALPDVCAEAGTAPMLDLVRDFGAWP